MVSSIVGGLTFCPLSILGLKVGYNDDCERSIEPEQVHEAAKKVAEIRPSDGHNPVHQEILANYRTLGERAAAIIAEHGPIVHDDDIPYPSILHIILEAEKRERLLDPNQNEPLALFDSPADESHFVVCHVCWAVVYRVEVELHMAIEHAGYCMICEQYIPAQDKDLMDHMKKQHQHCSLCLDIPDVGQYYEHLKTNHPCQCGTCLMQFKSHKLLSHHLREQHEWDVNLHIDKVPRSSTGTVDCPLKQCGKKIFLDGLGRHIFGEGKGHHALKACLHCRTAKQRRTMLGHLSLFHNQFCCGRHMDPEEYDFHRWIEHGGPEPAVQVVLS